MKAFIGTLFLGITLTSQLSLATFVDLNTLYYSDQFTTAGETKIAHTAWDLGVGYEIGSGKRFSLAINYGSTTQTETFAGNTTTFTNSDTGIKLFYFWTRSKTWSSTLTYNLISKATYDDGTSEVELRGTSIKADFGYNFWIGDYSAVAVKLYYYKPTFTESVATSTITEVSYNRATINPGLGFVYIF